MGRQSDGAPQRDDGIEDGAGGVGKRRNLLQRGGVGEGPAAPDEPGAVGFAGDLTLLAALTHHQMQQPGRLFFFGAGAAGAKNGGRWAHEFGLHEQIAEGGMGCVRGGSREHHFRITGQFDDARAWRMIGERDAPQLHVVFRRNADFGVDFEAGMTLAKLGARLREDGFVAFRCAQGGLMGGGPEFSRGHIAQIDKRSPAIARGILAPAGDRQIPPAAVAAARAADRRHDSGRWTRDGLPASAKWDW